MSTHGETGSQRSPGRPRKFDEPAALDAAIDAFWKNGVRGTSTRDLEVALSMRQSSIYHAFGSKQGLLEASLDRYIARASETLLVPLESSPLGVDAIDAFVVAVGEWISAGGYRGCLVVNNFSQPNSDAGVQQRTQAYLERVNAALAGALSRAASRGEIAPESVADRASVLSGIVLGLTVAGRGGRAARGDFETMLTGVHELLREWRCSLGRYRPAVGR